MRSFWPPQEAAQADYERLRAAVLEGTSLADSAGVRFGRRGLAGLIVAPVADPVFVATIVGGTRPRWSPYADPRLEALARAYNLLLARPLCEGTQAEMSR